jgi:hypothetical protein
MRSLLVLDLKLERKHASRHESLTQSPMSETLWQKSSHESALLQNIRRGKFLSCLNQIGNFVSNFFKFLSSPGSALCRKRNSHIHILSFGFDSIMDIAKSADGSAGTEVWPGIQRHVKCFAIRPVDYRRVPGESNESFPAVLALVGVPPQSKPPFSLAIFAGNAQEDCGFISSSRAIQEAPGKAGLAQTCRWE